MTLEELKAIFAQAEATPGQRGGPGYYTYYIPNGSGVVDTDKVDTILENVSPFVHVGYFSGSPVFVSPEEAKQS
jgi:hypothetical protein